MTEATPKDSKPALAAIVIVFTTFFIPFGVMWRLLEPTSFSERALAVLLGACAGYVSVWVVTRLLAD